MYHAGRDIIINQVVNIDVSKVVEVLCCDISESCALFDPVGRLIYANDAWRTMEHAPCSAKRNIESVWDWYGRYYDDAPDVVEKVLSVYDTGKTELFVMHHKLWECHCRITPMFPGTDINGVLCVGHKVPLVLDEGRPVMVTRPSAKVMVHKSMRMIERSRALLNSFLTMGVILHESTHVCLQRGMVYLWYGWS